MLNQLRYLVVGALAAGLFTVGPPGVAAACACGALVSPDSSAHVADEQALVSSDGHTETIIMRLNLQSTSDNAALVFPTPTPATVSAASPAVFEELDELSAPRSEGRVNIGILPGSYGGAPSAQAPTVMAQVQLGPLEATTLSGGDIGGVREWLATHGYTMRPDVVAHLDPYLRQGWSFVAMRLTSPTPLNGQLDPVKLVFTADQFVYPMRLSAAAHTSQRVLIYTLAAHRMQRDDADARDQVTRIEYAGSIAGRTRNSTLTELANRAPYLTRMTVQIFEPANITSDFRFVPAPNDQPHQMVEYHDVDITPVVMAVAVGVVVLGVGVSLVLIRRSRRRSTAAR